MTESTAPDERPYEEALREILEPLDRQLARVVMFFPIALVTVVPAVFFLFWLYYDFTARRAIVVSGGAFCGLVALYMLWELIVSRLARRRFDIRFPPGTAERGIALRILAEMETPSKAEEKLRVALASSSSDRIIRRRHPTSGENETASTGQTGAPLPQRDQQVIRRTAGAYDYIPLEPRKAEGEPPGEGRT